jgi:acylphosphatase
VLTGALSRHKAGGHSRAGALIGSYARGGKTELMVDCQAMDAETQRKSVHVTISGRVQAVGFRYWTERNAVELELDGWVRNRGDDTVEAVFCGAGNAVGEMLVRCRSGPQGARVADVRVEEEGGPVPDGFVIKPTV